MERVYKEFKERVDYDKMYKAGHYAMEYRSVEEFSAGYYEDVNGKSTRLLLGEHYEDLMKSKKGFFFFRDWDKDEGNVFYGCGVEEILGYLQSVPRYEQYLR